MGTWTRTATPRLTFESSISITRSTPGFPTPNHTDPAVKFNDGLFEAFNSAAGSVMQAYGNLFQGRENVAYVTANHAFKFGAEFRGNRDTTYFGISPNGEYDFGGGTAYAPEARPSIQLSGTHNVSHSGSAARYSLRFSLRQFLCVHGCAGAAVHLRRQHIGPAAISRNDVNAYFAGHVEGDVDFHAGLRHPLGTLHADYRARQTHVIFPDDRRRAAVRGQSTARLSHRLESVGAAGAGVVATGEQLLGPCGRCGDYDSAQYLAG